MENAGSWTTLENGTNIWRLMLTVPGALAMSVSFSQFNIPAGGSLYLYDTRGDFIIGAFTSENNKRQGLFSTQLIPGDSIILEYASAHVGQGNPALWINHIGYAYRYVPKALIYQGRSGDCQVNVACPEGDLYMDQRSGVARIYLLDEGNYYWCSGSLVNNTARNRDPYFLTADHCAEDVSPSDLSQWVFYFNYVSSDCAEDIPPAANQTMSGAVLMAHAGTSGSDFLLLLLDDYVPDSYNPYFLGWNREDSPSPRGASLHHPDGDVMKISTYQEPLVSSQWSSSPGTHWQVYWSATDNGWGVTEGGSSGSPLLDDEGFLVGTLTGGLSDCEPGGGG
jgi:hypothetical protein